MIAAELLLIAAGAALLFWAVLICREAAWLEYLTGPEPDPYAGEVAEFRRQLHDWDRQDG